ncbi:separin [Coccidioides immitis H538.4]|uniref:Separin n=1 Tax=Coccidioides immitis H538.4 TaxID=396776 RepID=A0A0J8RMR3_COCIT|nr:separin [Coccidioides immitis H538.4]
MANQTLHSLVDSVKSSVLSPSTCTSDTVSLLRKLLSAVDDERKTGERKSAKTVKAGSSSRRQPRTGNSRATTKVAVFQTRTESPIPPLSKQNKIALATEIFNASSRTLSEHIKLQSPRPFDNALKKNTVTKNPGSPKKPLQPTSPNRTIRSPTKAKGISERLNERNTAASNVTGVAESALLALSSLRDLKCNEDGTRILNVQLEQGLCILIGKLFAVGLNNMAIRELRLLKGRIRAYFDSETPKVKLRRTANPAKEIQSERASEKMEDLVLVPKVPEDGAMIQLFVSLQNLALRAVITEGQPATAQKMMNHLVFSNPCSPPNLILAAYKFGTLSADKAAQQLQSLSSSILSLAALTVSPGEGVPCSMKSRIKPTVTVALQILSLEVKCLWWKMAGHRYDADKELWHPLARYFSALTRHCSAIKKADFECIKEAFLRLKTSLNSNGYNVNIRNVKSASVSIVLRILGQLAYTAGCLSDAIEFYRISKDLPSSSAGDKFGNSDAANNLTGTLELASAQSFQRPFRYIWKNPQSPAYALGRVLGSYIKARLKQVRKTSQLAYDDEALDVESRALLLESQMAFLVDSFAVDPSDMLAQCLASMITKLLAIYSIDIFPLRRSRVLVSSLRLFLESNIDFDSDFCDYLSQEAKSCLSQGLELYKDQDLYPYQEDIMSSLRLALGFYSGDLQTADLQLVIQSWAKMSQSWATWESVEAKISDPSHLDFSTSWPCRLFGN